MSPTRLPIGALLLLLTSLAGSHACSEPDEAPGPDRDTDADTDADIDADSDSDVDADADSDPGDTGWEEGAIGVVRGPDALAGVAATHVQGFGGAACGEGVVPARGLGGDGAAEVLVLCVQPGADLTVSGLLHRVSGAALLEGRPEVLSTLSGVPLIWEPEELRGTGDLDGDARGEVGLRSGAGSGTDLGYVAPGSTWSTDAALRSVAWRLRGESGYVGVAPQVVRDVDGDTIADLVIAQQPVFHVDEDSVGTRLIVVPGSALQGIAAAATVDVRAFSYLLEGRRSLGDARVIGAVGDVDGDGLGDVGVAFGPRDEPGPDQAGDLRIVLSSTLGAVALDDCPSVTGVFVGRLMGSHFWPLGDLDADGRGELAVSFVKRGDTSSDNLVEFGIVRGADIVPATTTVLEPWELDLHDLWGAPCDLDGDGFPEWVSEDGIWAGTDLLSATPTPWAAGIDVTTCLGDLDGDGTEDVAVVGRL